MSGGATTKAAVRIAIGEVRRKARKTVLVTVRFTPDEFEALAREGAANGENVSETVRRKCVGRPADPVVVAGAQQAIAADAASTLSDRLSADEVVRRRSSAAAREERGLPPVVARGRRR